ncbi:tetratricopeptide repeat-containing sulfotransferase family protein [Halioglobus maricola]|nr:sulfotransferase [Halioglobus maricola]
MGGRQAALQCSERAVHLKPDSFAFLSQQAQCLLVLNRQADSAAITDKLSGVTLDHAVQFDTLGNLYSQLNSHAKALGCFEQAVALEPANPHFHFNRALILQSMGELTEAEQAFDRVIDLEPDLAEAWLHRSRLRTQRQESNHVNELAVALGRPELSWREEMNLRYALAKEHEDLGQYDESFAELGRASRLRRGHMKHDAVADLRAIDGIIDAFGASYFSVEHIGANTRAPIFIVGLPRTGTTLVERIIGAHSEVIAAGELNNFAECLGVQLAAQKPTDRLDFIRRAAGVDHASLGEAYIESTRHLAGNSARFIDKLPLNFLYCGLIHRAMPNAKIVHLSRHPMDTCYAIYKTLFKQAYPFSYELLELGNYYLSYCKLMAHWRQMMPGAIYDVSYERLVSNPEYETRQLIQACGLEWEDRCLQFHKSSAPSMTASLAQVRKPMYTSSVGRWQQYRDGLRPLEDLFLSEGLNL